MIDIFQKNFENDRNFEKFLETKEILQKTLENYQSFRKFLEKFPKLLSKKTDFSIIGWGSPPPPPPLGTPLNESSLKIQC